MQERGLPEFDKFATSTFNALVKYREEKLRGFQSDLRTLARLDITVMRSISGKVDYFVNQVKMTPSMSLYLGVERSAAAAIATTIAEAFRLKSIYRRSKLQF